MQVEKYIGKAFSYTNIFDVVKIIETAHETLYYVKVGEFINRTWGNDHPNIEELDGISVLLINKRHFKFIRKLSSLEQELY
jgi:hypothetical protein